MKKLILFELRKVFSKRLALIALIGIILFSALLSFSTFQNKYPWEYNTFILGGDVILIENDLLADALNALPQDNRDILLMYWFLEMADREIAERMNLARRTINNRRLKSYRLLKELMGGDTDA